MAAIVQGNRGTIIVGGADSSHVIRAHQEAKLKNLHAKGLLESDILKELRLLLRDLTFQGFLRHQNLILLRSSSLTMTFLRKPTTTASSR